jgi:chromate reductase
MKIVAISGSLRKDSFNTSLLRAAQGLAPSDMEISIADISEIPIFNSDLQQDGLPDAVTRLVEAIREADGVLIATPEYNYSVPGVLKNAIDWVSRGKNQPFGGKAIGIMGASMGNLGTARAQYHLRQVFVFLNGIIMNRPELFVGAAHQKFDDQGKLIDQVTADHVSKYLVAFQAWTQGVQKMAG